MNRDHELLSERLRRLELYGVNRNHPSDVPRREPASVFIFHMSDVQTCDASAVQIFHELFESYRVRFIYSCCIICMPLTTSERTGP